MRKTKSKSQNVFDRLAAASTALHVSVAELKAAKRLAAPGFEAGRVRVDKLLPWLKKHREKLAQAGVPRAELECRKLQVQCERLEHELALKRGEYVKTAQVVAAIHSVSSAIRSLLERKLENEYPTAVASMDPPQCRIFGKRLNDSICEEFQKMAVAFESIG